MQIPRAVPVSAFGRPAAQELHPGLSVAGGCCPCWGALLRGRAARPSPFLDTIVITGGQNRACEQPTNRHNKRLQRLSKGAGACIVDASLAVWYNVVATQQNTKH